MWTLPITHRRSALAVVIIAAVVACTAPDESTGVAAHHVMASKDVDNANPTSAAGDDKGFINGYLDGTMMALRYTRTYFCAEPPESIADTGCEVGAPPTIAPRSGPIPKIYALAPAGFTPDPSTVHCKGGTVCMNHPPTLDLTRLGIPTPVFAPAHSHVLEVRQSGWHNTVNIRVLSLAAWNEIAEAKSLTKVRELQAQGRVGPDLPTNVYFFFEVQNVKPQ